MGGGDVDRTVDSSEDGDFSSAGVEEAIDEDSSLEACEGLFRRRRRRRRLRRRNC